jgi:hypothetical protein
VEENEQEKQTQTHAGPIRCPACKSKISPDGKSLFERSAEFEKLRKDAAKVRRLAETVAALERDKVSADAVEAEKEGKPGAAAPVEVKKEVKPGGAAPALETKKGDSENGGKKPWWASGRG